MFLAQTKFHLSIGVSRLHSETTARILDNIFRTIPPQFQLFHIKSINCLINTIMLQNISKFNQIHINYLNFVKHIINYQWLSAIICFPSLQNKHSNQYSHIHPPRVRSITILVTLTFNTYLGSTFLHLLEEQVE